MGDIYPYGGPAYVDFATARQQADVAGFGAGGAIVAAAIGMAESSLNYRVINDTPSTGDYSVGIWQINYYGSLYAGRAAQFGTPRQLVAGGVTRQARAAFAIQQSQGWGAWSTFTSGAYLRYMPGGRPAPGGPGIVTPGPQTAIRPPTEDYSGTLLQAATSLRNMGQGWANAATVLARLRR